MILCRGPVLNGVHVQVCDTITSSQMITTAGFGVVTTADQMKVITASSNFGKDKGKAQGRISEKIEKYGGLEKDVSKGFYESIIHKSGSGRIEDKFKIDSDVKKCLQNFSADKRNHDDDEWLGSIPPTRNRTLIEVGGGFGEAGCGNQKEMCRTLFPPRATEKTESHEMRNMDMSHLTRAYKSMTMKWTSLPLLRKKCLQWKRVEY
ncbi:hypothetical protein OSB04_007192 [Centaurea solstitialis]|uniref:Uncharacterized protein n=1 Tax=Centaurea solstitialis TaxID=347529 RepID=A0AA38U2N5_9ASTR|nr:hypothetical protein OSB04_007192 [Centaurea solstitialis]